MSSLLSRIRGTRAIKPCQKFEGHTIRISDIMHLPCGQRIMTCSYDGSLRLWSLGTGLQIGEDWQDGDCAVISMALSPDGKRVVSGSGDGAVRLWNIDTGKVITKWTGHAGSVKSLCWNRDGGQVVSGSFDGTARVWDVEGGESILGPIKVGSDVNAVIYSPNETMIATAVPNMQKEFIKVWDAKTGRLIAALKHKFTVTCLAWTGRTLISGSLDSSIGTWNTTTWQQMAVFAGHTNAVIDIAISPNSRILASASLDGTVRLWTLDNGQPISSPLQHVNAVSCVSFSADGNQLATGCADNNAYSWDISATVKLGLQKLVLNRNGSDEPLLDADATWLPGQQLENTHLVPPDFSHDSPHHPHSQSSRRRSLLPPSVSPAPPPASPSPPPASPALPLARSPLPSVYHHYASRSTFLDCASSLFRRTHTKDSNLRPLPSSQAEETPTPTKNDVDADAPLCSICSALDICAILLDPEERAVPLGQLTSILDKHDQCGLCRLIAVIVRRSWNLDEKPNNNVAGITCELYAEAIGGFDAYECRDLGIPERVLPARKDLCHRLRITTSSRPRGVMDAMIAAQSNLFLEIQLLEEDASKVGRTTGLHGRRVGQTVDINLLKRWIHICEHEHRERCETAWWRNPREVLPKSVRVLDVAHMVILPAPRSCRYVALSYVWGGPGEDYWTTQANLKQRSRRGGLDISVLPATIRDTIQLVRQLGERYLWIDALCIVQDDPKDKTKQINVMERIYGKAVFTIFAASGTSVRDPLPGVRPGTRDPKQEIAKIQGLHLAVPLILPSESVLSSVWNMRGWTYQELMLSRRRIFFTPHHVHFECVKEVFGEDIVAEPIIFPWTVHPLWLAGMGKVMNGVKSPDDMKAVRLRNWGVPADEYMTMIGEYTLRKLTVESDIVDAITAIINAMTKGYHWAGGNPGKAFRFGMPIGDLERALVWQPLVNPSNEQRVAADGNRMSSPSWSWAAWRGAVRYDGGEILVGEEDVHSLPQIQDSLVEQWHLVDDDGKLVRQDVWSTGGAGNEDHWAIYVVPKGDIDPRQLIRENAPLRPGTLVFRTSSSYFDVTKTDDIIDINANYGIHSILSDIPLPSTRVGRIILPCSTRSPTSFEFVVLSRTSGRPGLFDEDRLDEHGIWKRVGYYGCMFYVMAVQKMRDEERMERVGVGVIFDRAWLNSRPEQKIVFLG